MTKQEYEQVRQDNPQLDLPNWEFWERHSFAYKECELFPLDLLKKMRPEELVPRRSAALLAASGPFYDQVHRFS